MTNAAAQALCIHSSNLGLSAAFTAALVTLPLTLVLARAVSVPDPAAQRDAPGGARDGREGGGDTPGDRLPAATPGPGLDSRVAGAGCGRGWGGARGGGEGGAGPWDC